MLRMLRLCETRSIALQKGLGLNAPYLAEVATMVDSQNLITSSSLSCDQQFGAKISEMRRITTTS